jgi:hypothetical protein
VEADRRRTLLPIRGQDDGGIGHHPSNFYCLYAAHAVVGTIYARHELCCGPPSTNSSNYDITPDGQRFLMIKDSDTESFPSQINIILNWTQELRRIMAEKGKS